ncbi:hypothetical protein [Photobacterium carnosum]|jgi:hypothetical protein|uniref:Uncharacterized protein n=1 Tax=Photobacterium iliopiscarium TaxID=56192 RepID=A0A2T3M4S5_9GAMM|nr:hypothetical protein [Photobacterium carnosum]MCD9516459.1 hypothetical protein [Photobacterium carnosum]PSV86877.1 hypothetical protein C9I88_20490 [Photobacterium iliopiscarium]
MSLYKESVQLRGAIRFEWILYGEINQCEGDDVDSVVVGDAFYPRRDSLRLATSWLNHLLGKQNKEQHY